jgi:hypothetical protein
MISKNVNLHDIIKRDLYNKFGDYISDIKKKINNDLTEEDKIKIINKITVLILLFQMDNLYKDITNSSGIESILTLFGFSEKNANNIRKLCSKSVNITSFAILIFKYLKLN